jgi:hypothetical protein
LSETEVKQDPGTSPESITDSQSEPQLEANNEVEGLKQGIQAERQKRQEAEQRAAFTEQLLQQQQVQPQQSNEYDYDPEDYPTNRDIEKMIEKKLQPYQQQTMSNVQSQNFNIARSKYSDFDKVVGPGSYFDRLQQQQPGLLQSIQDQPNAAELAYQIGQSHPEYKKQAIEKATQEVTTKIESNLAKPNTLSGTGGTDAEKEQADKFAKMSDAEFRAEVQKVKNQSKAQPA